MTRDEFIEALLSAPHTEARLFLTEGNAEHMQINIVYALKERADQSERDDARQAFQIGQIAAEVAEHLADDEARAVALWIQANAQDLLADLESAAHSYDLSAQLFKAAGKPLESSRTSLGHMETLAKLGRFDQAQSLAEAARRVFVEFDDLASQATADMNLGNLYYRRGNYVAALEAFRQAAQAFQALGNELYAAMNQINQANMLTVLDDFLGAEKLHEQARPVFENAELRTAVASVDLNMAILQSYRGNYSKAFQIFEQARAIFSSLSSQVNLAMTDLEESDLHLELNLPERAYQLSERAEQVLAELQMPFELNRARGNRGIALARMDKLEQAEALLEEVRASFASQENSTWVAQTDLQRAEVMGRMGTRDQSRQLAAEALQTYSRLGMKARQAYAHIVCANLWVDDKKWDYAMQELDAAERAIAETAAPWLESRIESCRGRIHEGMGQLGEAIEHYRMAAGHTEKMMAVLTAEEHRTAYIADKLQPYEALVSLYASNDPQLAFQWAEQAKSRALVDLLAAGIRPRLHIQDDMDARNAERLQVLREELNWLYMRLTRGEAPGDPSAPAAIPETWAKIQEREKEASVLWRSLQARHAEELSLFREAPLSASEVQGRLPEDTAILEYFIARDQLIIFLLTKQDVFAYPSTSAADVLPLLEELAFQFSKFQYGPAYYERHKTTLLRTVQDLLDRLGDKLVSPVWERLAEVKALNIIPHGPLHALPFHALRQDSRYLIETHAVSYAPSAAVLSYCWNKSSRYSGKQPFDGTPLLVGVPDERATQVTQEIQTLAALIHDSHVLLGGDATLERVRTTAPGCGLLHLAAHGLFRPEAPLLSSIHLADKWMAVQDVYDLDLKASLVTLSACETGLGHDEGGDEMVGLVRGFLHAGASSLLVSLWMVDDKSMTDLMTRFYTHWLTGMPKSQALRQAQVELIGQYEHPYYWAPMVLVGNEK
ncbi:MAG TPA: CHAT domain-containing protein [Anaerolineales bacterium]|nr:CHAT domain-containing protein [Anaerolineales bacterium]